MVTCKCEPGAVKVGTSGSPGLSALLRDLSPNPGRRVSLREARQMIFLRYTVDSLVSIGTDLQLHTAAHECTRAQTHRKHTVLSLRYARVHMIYIPALTNNGGKTNLPHERIPNN